MPEQPSRRHGARVNQHGFTLLEVLVAFVLLAMLLAGVLRVTGGSTRSSRIAADYAEAAIVADELVARTRLEASLEAGETSGEFNEKFQWRRRVSVYQESNRRFDANPKWLPYLVSIAIDWRSDGKQRGIEVTTLQIGAVQ